MLLSTSFSFILLIGLSALLEIVIRRRKKSANQNPQFLAFQKSFLGTQLVILLADWLQAPYNYKLYSSYHYTQEQIVIIFVAGHAFSVIFTPFASFGADRFGRRTMCCISLAMYSASCVLKAVNDYSTLVISSIMASCSSLLVFSSAQAWYNHEHIENHDFPIEWISETLDKIGMWSGVLSVVAGVIAFILAEITIRSPSAPFIASIPLFMLALCMAWSNWAENKSTTRGVKFSKSCMNGLREIFENRPTLYCGLTQALFEAVISIFVFLWTPVLDKHQPPLGIVFASFMTANVAGSRLYSLALDKFSAKDLLIGSSMIGAASTMILTWTSHPDANFPYFSFLSLTLFQLAVGIYTAAMATTQNELIPHQHRSAVSSWFRIPLKLIACIGLVSLHSDDNEHGNRKLFIGCTTLMTLAIGASLLLRASKKKTPNEVAANNDRLIESTQI